MIIITGAAGFIGSNIVSGLIASGYSDLVAVDLDENVKSSLYLKNKGVKDVKFDDMSDFILENHRQIQAVIHMGACSDTTETDTAIFSKYNLGCTKMLWNHCADFGIPFVYASSAATYGDGDFGYGDNHELLDSLVPLNLYGHSKHNFDLWALKQDKQPPHWSGLKFFNVYGPNEDHKGRMASVVRHAYFQIKDSGAMKLFRSHHPDFQDGEQTRDFVYVKDVVLVIIFLIENRPQSAIYNLGFGEGRTFNDLVKNTFTSMGLEPQISYIDTPIDIRDKYQYYTCADISKLRKVGYDKPFTSLEDGVKDYVQCYLMKETFN